MPQDAYFADRTRRRSERLFVRCAPEEIAYLDRQAEAMGTTRAQAARILIGRASIQSANTNGRAAGGAQGAG